MDLQGVGCGRVHGPPPHNDASKAVSLGAWKKAAPQLRTQTLRSVADSAVEV